MARLPNTYSTIGGPVSGESESILGGRPLRRGGTYKTPTAGQYAARAAGVGNMAKPNAKAPLGQGGRFAALKQSLGRQGIRNPAALAASIGRKKYGAKRMAKMSAAGRK